MLMHPGLLALYHFDMQKYHIFHKKSKKTLDLQVALNFMLSLMLKNLLSKKGRGYYEN